MNQGDVSKPSGDSPPKSMTACARNEEPIPVGEGALGPGARTQRGESIVTSKLPSI